MSQLEIAAFTDLITLLVCTVLLVRYGRLAHSHPATIYLFFHIYSFTLRLFKVLGGAPTLFTSNAFYTWGPAFEPINQDEIARAIFMADLALIVMTAAWIRAAIVATRKANFVSNGDQEPAPTLTLKHIWRVVAFAFPIGVVGFVALSRRPGGENVLASEINQEGESYWISMTQTWAGLSLLALIYWYGFRRWLMLPMVIYLMAWAYQGYHRYRLIIPILLLIQIYLDRRKLKWPSFRIVVLLLMVAVLFFPLKNIGTKAQAGASLDEILASSLEILKEAGAGEQDDGLFLDEFASGVTLIDRNEKFYFGATYLPLLVNPIPRSFWPDKPGLADYIGDFSRPWRPMKEIGLIVTFLGESYANFGYVGIIIIPYGLAYWLARGYFRAYRSSYFSVARFTYLLIACNLIQVYRDGLISIVEFTLVNMMPLMFIVFLHYLIPIKPVEPIPAAKDYKEVRIVLPSEARVK